MKTIFLKGLDHKDEEDMKSSFIASITMRKKLEEILENKIEITHKWQSSKDYAKSNWAFEQADAMGYVRALEEVISLMSLKKIEPDAPKGRGRPRGVSGRPTPLNQKS